MDKDTWLHIYNNLQRMNFYAYLEAYEPRVLENFNQRFSEFLKERLNTNEDLNHVRFFGGDFLISFAYHSLAQVFEFLQTHFEKKYQLDEFLSKVGSNFDFKSFLERSDLNVIKPTKDQLYRDGFQSFVRRLRNALSHSNYDFPDYYSIRMWNFYNKENFDLKVILRYDDFLNFCKNFGFEVNKELISKGFLRQGKS